MKAALFLIATAVTWSLLTHYAYAVETTDIEDITIQIISENYRSDKPVRELTLPVKARDHSVERAQNRETSSLSRANTARSQRQDTLQDNDRRDAAHSLATEAKAAGLAKVVEAKERANEVKLERQEKNTEAKQMAIEAKDQGLAQASVAKETAEEAKQQGLAVANDARDNGKDRAAEAKEQQGQAKHDNLDAAANAIENAQQAKQTGLDRAAAARDAHAKKK